MSTRLVRNQLNIIIIISSSSIIRSTIIIIIIIVTIIIIIIVITIVVIIIIIEWPHSSAAEDFPFVLGLVPERSAWMLLNAYDEANTTNINWKLQKRQISKAHTQLTYCSVL